MTREKFLLLIANVRKARDEHISQSGAIEILKSAGLENEASVLAPMQAAIARARADESYNKESIGNALKTQASEFDTVKLLEFAEQFADLFRTEEEVKAMKEAIKTALSSMPVISVTSE